MPAADVALRIDGDEVRFYRAAWAMLGLADPSSRQFTDPQPDGTIGLEPLPESARVGIEVFDSEGQPIGEASPLRGWEPWQRVVWHERRKAGWDTLREAFAESVR